MQTIKILDEHIANQIAAGEVVERPISVVKELIENAIDAKATRISIDIIQGGLDLIRVVDNGIGMTAIDTKLAFERHATSKISNAKSLFKIKTLGFRGEALPSIAAISRLEIKTRKTSDSLGNYLQIEGGKKTDIEPVGCPAGTEIVVKDLFFNTPARLKYLKSVTTEANHINEYVSKMAMAYPNISFSFSHNNKQLFKTQGNDQLYEVLINIYGSQTRANWLSLQSESLDFELRGLVAKPEFSRASRQHCSFFVNGRYIRNAKLFEAVMKAYHTLLPINKFPVACIHISMDYSLVDVNVHPAKLEVRFSKENELYKLLLDSVQATLSKNNLIPEISAYHKNKSYRNNNYYKSTEQSNNKDNQNKANENKANENKANENKEDSLENNKIKNFTYHDTFTIEPKKETINAKVLTVHEPIRPILISTFQTETLESIQMSTIATESREPTHTDAASMNPPEQPQEYIFAEDQELDCSVVGQIHGTYIVAEDKSGMLLIDQHAAHERINYEKAMTTIKNQQVKKQDMLVPIQLQYTKAEMQIIKENKDKLDRFAVDFDEFGEKTIIIRAYPDWIPHNKVYEFTTYIFDKMITQKDRVNIVELLEESSILFACKSSIKANQRLSMEEMKRLIVDLRATSSPYTCPHGRPIVVHYSAYEMEKLFKRKN